MDADNLLHEPSGRHQVDFIATIKAGKTAAAKIQSFLWNLLDSQQSTRGYWLAALIPAGGATPPDIELIEWLHTLSTPRENGENDFVSLLAFADWLEDTGRLTQWHLAHVRFTAHLMQLFAETSLSLVIQDGERIEFISSKSLSLRIPFARALESVRFITEQPRRIDDAFDYRTLDLSTMLYVRKFWIMQMRLRLDCYVPEPSVSSRRATQHQYQACVNKIDRFVSRATYNFLTHYRDEPLPESLDKVKLNPPPALTILDEQHEWPETLSDAQKKAVKDIEVTVNFDGRPIAPRLIDPRS